MRRAVAGVALFSALFFVLTRAFLRTWKPSPARGTHPVTFFRPLKPGEPALREKLTRFLAGTRPADRILLGTSSEPEYSAACAIRDEHPERDIVVVACQPGVFANPKINKLAQMEPFAGPERWIALDSDTLCDVATLEALRGEWTDSDALTAPYVFVGARSVPSRFDAAATALGLWPGVALLRRFGPPRAMFGACLGVTATALRTLGGWAAFGDELAEDNALGRRLAAAGFRIHLAGVAIPLDAGRMTWKDALLHQHRVQATYHRCDPKGALGLPLTHGIPLTLAAFAVRPRLWLLATHTILLLLRGASARELPGRPRLSLAEIWLVSLAEPLFWTAGFLNRSPHWKGWGNTKGTMGSKREGLRRTQSTEGATLGLRHQPDRGHQKILWILSENEAP